MAYNVSGVAEPAQRFAERPASKERFTLPKYATQLAG